MNKNDKILVTGAGGFIGGQLVGHLLKQGFSNVRAVDYKEMPDWYSFHPEAESIQRDLRLIDACQEVTSGVDYVYQSGGRHGRHGFHREQQGRSACCRVLINTHLLMAARERGREALLLRLLRLRLRGGQADATPTSPRSRKRTPTPRCRKTATAGRSCSASGCAATSARTSACRPASPVTTTSTARTAPTRAAARRRRPRSAARSSRPSCRGRHEIEIWGDGKQTRSFMYIDDCLKGTQTIMDSDFAEPINLGSDELVTINQLVDIVEEIAGIKLKRTLQPRRPQGRQRPQQRQHADQANVSAGRRASACVTAWRRPTAGSTTR